MVNIYNLNYTHLEGTLLSKYTTQSPFFGCRLQKIPDNFNARQTAIRGRFRRGDTIFVDKQ
jgi:hypothetical protein